MADGTELDLGTGGDVVATAEASFAGTAKKVQVIGFGIVSGSTGAFVYTLSPGGAGAVTAGVPRFTLASDDPAVIALQIMDDWDEADRAKANIVVGQAGISAGAGAVAANTPRVTLASDDPSIPLLTAIAGYLDTETAAMVAATQAILTAAQIIDDWDEADRGKVNLIVGQAGIQGGAGAVTSLTVRVAIATDANAVSLAASELHLGQTGGSGVHVSATLTRPANTTPYEPGDAVTNHLTTPAALTFNACGRISGGSGWITGAKLIDSANQTVKGSFEAWIFKSASMAPDNDGAVFTPTDAELANLVCIIRFETPFVGDATAGAGGNCVYIGEVVNGPARFKCDGNDDLFAPGLVVRNAYTPVNAEEYTIILDIDQD